MPRGELALVLCFDDPVRMRDKLEQAAIEPGVRHTLLDLPDQLPLTQRRGRLALGELQQVRVGVRVRVKRLW